MKCPQCGHKQGRKRDGMKCRKCGRRYVLEPEKNFFAGSPTADGKFLAIMKKATAQGTRFVTENELFTHAGLLSRRSAIGCWLATAFVAAFISCWVHFFFKQTSDLYLPIWAVAPIIILLIYAIGSLNYRPRRGHWDKIVEHWCDEAGTPPNLLREPGLHEPPPEWPEADIYDYGAEKIIIVERDILVDWLVRNRLHLDQNALVIAQSGYPHYLAERARTMLAERPDLPVFLLHDATRKGRKMKDAAVKAWSLERHPVTDLGIYPEDAGQLKLPRFLRREAKKLPVDSLRFERLCAVMGAAMLAGTSLAEAVSTMTADSGAEIDFG